MPDRPAPASHAPRDWHDAFDALPSETPPSGGWNALATRLDARASSPAPRAPGPNRRHRWPLWMATAAALMLAIALPWRLQQAPGDDLSATTDTAPVASAATTDDPLQQLYAESAQLESLLAVARDDSVSSATAALLASELDHQLATIDAALMQPGLSREQQLSLWQQRVDGLRTLSGFESNRRWLAAHGTRYDAALVVVD